ncbi:DegT/DnrJ/EryC1/StrS aminotransferase family protein [Aquimarina sp. I32.4]|uniref:DegT/DnrJ/EryC1/StrS family aminotransferase n=1 Tax=Aquimarina sp. I32.4 TaxID=2053903 RepID=UPI000CDEE366|nr:DegT/DnrJ/EryC1/StrS family aminotransferase [Aquimarina sp. I32.4]
MMTRMVSSYNTSIFDKVKNQSTSTPPDIADDVILYENNLKEYYGCKYALALTSGTASIIVALHALGIDYGDQVITSPAAPMCTAFPIMYATKTVLFSDICNDNFGLDIDKLKNLDLKNIKAIVEVPMWGYPTDMIKLRDFAKNNNIALIADLALSPVTKIHAKYLFNYADIACYSTQQSKLFSTGGEGGYIITNNEELYEKAFSFSRMGNLDGVNFGVNFKISDLQAKEGTKQLSKLHETIELRKYNANYIRSRIKSNTISEIKILNSGEPSYQRMVLLCQTGNTELINDLTHKNHIQSDVVSYNIKPLYDYPILAKYKTKCPNTERILSTMTTIPLHLQYNNQLDKIITIINNH